MEGNMEDLNLHVLIFDSKYYVGKPSADKSYLMVDVVELTPVFKEGSIHHVPCFLGDLKPMKSNDWLIAKVARKSVLFQGYLDILTSLQSPIDNSEGLNEIIN
jgi:hypothetical protein